MNGQEETGWSYDALRGALGIFLKVKKKRRTKQEVVLTHSTAYYVRRVKHFQIIFFIYIEHISYVRIDFL
jgi:hypothetical protein